MQSDDKRAFNNNTSSHIKQNHSVEVVALRSASAFRRTYNNPNTLRILLQLQLQLQLHHHQLSLHVFKHISRTVIERAITVHHFGAK